MNLPKIGIVVATYLADNQKYLDDCLKSIKGLTYDHNLLDVIVISSGDYIPDTHGHRAYHSSEQTHYPESINIGVSRLAPDCDYYLLLNDDTILTKNSVLQLAVGAQAVPNAIHQPISTCDNFWRYLLFLQDAAGRPLSKRFYRYGEWVYEDMVNAESPINAGFMIVDFVCFYATLIPKKVWDIVGPLDPKFKTGQDDLDYCKRARLNGINCVINLGSLIFHYGGVTADQALTPEIRQENIDYFRMKWGENIP